jgi:predicted NodU family carbamoyl transferase
MVVVGITGRRRRAATAVAVDGRIVAAVREAMVIRVPAAGYRETGFPVASFRACLAKAGLTPDSIDHVVSAEGAAPGMLPVRDSLSRAAKASGLERALFCRTSVLEASARQAAIGLESGIVLTTDLQRSAAAVGAIEGASPSTLHPLGGLAAVLSLTPRLGRFLGLTDAEPEDVLQSLELLARSALDEPASLFETMDAAAESGDLCAVSDAFDKTVARTEQRAGASLADAASPRIEVQRERARLAEGFLHRVALLLATALDAAAQRYATDRAVLAGGMFTCADFNARLGALSSLTISVAPVPSPEGAALGAALRPFTSAGADGLPNHLALGPSFSESEAKKALESCRLDYVYEPVWPRLIERVVQVLGHGKLVAWFQDSAEFDQSLRGSRSILADPSNRYARDNVNSFLRRRPHDWPIGVSIPAAASGCLSSPDLSPWRFVQARVKPEWREHLRGAADRSGSIHAHVLPADGSDVFHGLLSLHHQRSGVPGLINVALHGSGEPTACSPLDAIRSTFSSAVDAMVIHRFLVMKDYWQLRARAS